MSIGVGAWFENHALGLVFPEIEEGIGIEFVQRAKAMDGAHQRFQSQGDVLDAELFKYVADELVREAGV